ncbi:MAG TPA: iron-sulfur cluster-binding domain-containing protein [Candidatus Corynebacterium gallistercoris]|uniref:Iron-sulfur cluster-binding domain-containing protein n=1 Tax=Candidatus Corynebacterium gallistercoris TaxID=2838530 RepID=A0A9D1S0P4_9CORY|nr:iron-sulfur cluster-binding domain-containing protein [Candidatus Corynebacterium gallistercoris]
MSNRTAPQPLVARALSRLAKALSSPLLPEDYASLFNPLRGRELRGRITNIEYFEEFIELTLLPGPSLTPFFHAGQFIGLGVRIDGRWKWRCYSITNAPADKATNTSKTRAITLGITPVPNGAVSTHVTTRLHQGDIIRMTAPGGDFYLPQPFPKKLLFVTAGAGITPIMSMLRWLRQETTPSSFPDVIHIHSERSGRIPGPYASEITALTKTHPTYTLRLWNSAEQGRLSMSQLPTMIPDVQQRQTYGCGPQGLLDELCQTLPQAHVERFSSTPTSDEELAQRGGTITFPDLERQTQCDGSTTILEAAEAAGVSLTHGCRMGICHTCVATITEGEAVDTRTGSVFYTGERLRTCCSVPHGDVSITQN